MLCGMKIMEGLFEQGDSSLVKKFWCFADTFFGVGWLLFEENFLACDDCFAGLHGVEFVQPFQLHAEILCYFVE